MGTIYLCIHPASSWSQAAYQRPKTALLIQPYNPYRSTQQLSVTALFEVKPYLSHGVPGLYSTETVAREESKLCGLQPCDFIDLMYTPSLIYSVTTMNRKCIRRQSCDIFCNFVFCITHDYT